MMGLEMMLWHQRSDPNSSGILYLMSHVIDDIYMIVYTQVHRGLSTKFQQ